MQLCFYTQIEIATLNTLLQTNNGSRDCPTDAPQHCNQSETESRTSTDGSFILDAFKYILYIRNFFFHKNILF